MAFLRSLKLLELNEFATDLSNFNVAFLNFVLTLSTRLSSGLLFHFYTEMTRSGAINVLQSPACKHFICAVQV